jgi:hypothetical protein
MGGRYVTFIELSRFRSRFTDLGLNDDDLRNLQQQLAEHPLSGSVVRGTAGLRKVRFAPPSMRQGKRGATRVCYLYLDVAGTVYLFTIYRKNEKTDLTPREVAEFRALVDELKEYHYG